MCGNLRAGSVGWNHLHVGLLDLSQFWLGANRRWWRGDGRQSTVCLVCRMAGWSYVVCLLPPSLPAACPPHGYFINIIMSWILKDFSQQENRGLLCHDLAISSLPLCHYVLPPHSLDCSSEVQWNYCGLWAAHYIVISSRTNRVDCILLMRWDGWLFGLAELQSCTWSSLSSHQSAIILACLGWTVWKQSNSLNQSRASKQPFY